MLTSSIGDTYTSYSCHVPPQSTAVLQLLLLNCIRRVTNNFAGQLLLLNSYKLPGQRRHLCRLSRRLLSAKQLWQVLYCQPLGHLTNRGE